MITISLPCVNRAPPPVSAMSGSKSYPHTLEAGVVRSKGNSTIIAVIVVVGRILRRNTLRPALKQEKEARCRGETLCIWIFWKPLLFNDGASLQENFQVV